VATETVERELRHKFDAPEEIRIPDLPGTRVTDAGRVRLSCRMRSSPRSR
jgi:hypothetical protein